MISSVEIRKSEIEGNGVFAKKKIKKGDVVFVFSDNAIEIRHEPGCHCDICKRCIQIGEFDWLYPKKDSFGWELNHSCKPNCGIKGKNIVAMKDISLGEEITIDYSMTTIDKDWKMDCLCGEDCCRKIIRSVQFLPFKIFNSYKGFMPEFVEDNYKD